MHLKDRINAFAKLGICLKDILFQKKIIPGSNLEKLYDITINARHYNGWFTEKNVVQALKAISLLLEKDQLHIWLSGYQFNKTKPKRIGVVMAGNIPLVGFHDFLCILITGNTLVGKLSSKDELLLPILSEILMDIEPGFKDKIEFATGKLENIDAIIGTGSNNTSRYLEYYYGKYPNIFRKNRNSVAILNGNETKKDLELLGKDIFTYFGLGCRNVSKLYLPRGYDLNQFFEGIVGFTRIMENNKYANNFDYHRSIYLMEQVQILENNLIILKEDSAIASPVATLHYEFYADVRELIKLLNQGKNNIQCVVSNENDIPGCIPFGTAQQPAVHDYADGIDTIQFLNLLNN